MKATDIENKNSELVHRRKDQILAAAKHIFAQKGYSSTRVDEISDYLNLGKGTIYRYFDDKKGLFLAVFENGMKQLQERMASNVDTVDNPKEKIMAAVSNFFDFFDNDRELIEIYMQVRSDFKEEFKEFYKNLYSGYIVKIQDNLRKGIETGMFRPQMDIEKTAEALTSTLQGILQNYYTRVLAYEKGTAEGQTKNLQQDSLSTRANAVTLMLLEGILKR